MALHLILVVLGLVLLLVGAEILVRGARALAGRFGISPLVIGLTVVAFGTSAPELFVSVTAALRGSADMAVGNIVGSNLFNILMIIGISAIILPVHISNSVIRREMPIMLIAMGLMVYFSTDLLISRWQGVVLTSGIFLYLFLQYMLIRSGRTKPEDIAIEIEEPEADSVTKCCLFILIGIVGLSFGSDLIVENGSAIARVIGISEFVIAVSLVAIGTSLPELATTVVAAIKGEPDLAVGNAVGSNIFNVFAVLGPVAIISPLRVDPLPLQFDMVFMGLSCLAVWILMYFNRDLGRISGVALIATYGIYMWQTFS